MGLPVLNAVQRIGSFRGEKESVKIMSLIEDEQEQGGNSLDGLGLASVASFYWPALHPAALLSD